MPLATARMPESLENLVRTAIEEYMNLNVIDHLVKYDGPIKLIRRSHDEIITTIRSGKIVNIFAVAFVLKFDMQPSSLFTILIVFFV